MIWTNKVYDFVNIFNSQKIERSNNCKTVVAKIYEIEYYLQALCYKSETNMFVKYWNFHSEYNILSL